VTRLGDVLADVKPGFATGDNLDDGVFQFRMHNFTRESALDLTKRRRVNATAKQLEMQSVAPGDVLFNATNSPELVGKSALVGELDEPAVFSNHFMRLRADLTKLDPVYLAHFLRFQFRRGVFRAMAKAWVNQATIGRDRLEGLDIPLPSLPEQRRVAAILDHTDALRDKRRQTLTHLDALTQSIFNEMFGKLSPERVAISSFADVRTGSTPSRDDSGNFGGSIPWVKTTEVQGRTIRATSEYVTEKGARNARLKMFAVGSVVVAMYGQGKTRGKSAILGVPATTNQACAVIEPNDSFEPAFLQAQLAMSYDRLRYESEGGNQPNLSIGRVSRFEVLLPAVDLQRKFGCRVKQIHIQLAAVQNAASANDALFTSLQAHAFRGEL